MDNKIKSKWAFLIQSRLDIRSVIGNLKLVGGHISYNETSQRIFNFITAKGMFSYNEATEEFKSGLQIR